MDKSTRRTAGEGSIYFNAARERWEGKVDLDAGPDGVRRRKTVTGRTKTAVVKKVRELVRAADAGEDIGAKSKTVAQVAEEWLAKGTGGLEESTFSVTAKLVRGHIIPGVGHHQVKKLTPEDVERWLAVEARTGKAKATLSKYRTTLSRILRWAMARRWVTWNVAAVVEVPKATRPDKKRRSLTEEEAGRLLAALDGDRLGPYFTVMLLTGCRPGELDGLRWDAVDLDAGTVSIEAAMKRASGGRPIGVGEVKTGDDSKGRRMVRLVPAAVDALRQRRVQQAADRLAAGEGYGLADPRWEGLVFVTEIGTPIYPSNMRRAFAAACTRADIEAIVPYELRHSAISLLRAAGVPDHEIQDLVGHTDGRMLQRYAHRVTPIVDGHVAFLSQLGRRRS